MINIRCKFVVADFLAMNLFITDFTATKIPMLTISNGKSVADYIIFIKLIFIYLSK
jgi:hypothetical protein